mmetsp:Transcript_13635/g.37345  ORF Transcript_13635/g.37345 Transcript_13635/m.37345 type:complete len:214 (-) Transcript_13635:448-1089(-)
MAKTAVRTNPTAADAEIRKHRINGSVHAQTRIIVDTTSRGTPTGLVVPSWATARIRRCGHCHRHRPQSVEGIVRPSGDPATVVADALPQPCQQRELLHKARPCVCERAHRTMHVAKSVERRCDFHVDTVFINTSTHAQRLLKVRQGVLVPFAAQCERPQREMHSGAVHVHLRAVRGLLELQRLVQESLSKHRLPSANRNVRQLFQRCCSGSWL